MVKDKTFKSTDRVEFEADKLERARSYEDRLQELGLTLVATTHMLVRNVKLYGPENAIFEKPMEKLRECINTIIAVDNKVNLQCAGTSFYLNDMLLRIDTKHIDSVRYLHEEFERTDVGGFSLDKSVNLQELRNFIYIFSNENQGQPDEDGVEGRKLQFFKLRSFEIAQEILDHQKEAEQAQNAKLDRRRYALVVFARLVHFMDKFMRGQRGEGSVIPMAQSRHLVQDLIDVCYGHKTHFLGLTTARMEASSLAYHAANVTALTVVFGIELGLSKERLRELATAALFHDIGKVDVDMAVLTKTEPRTAEETRTMARVPRLTVHRLLKARALDLGNMHNIVVAYQHQIPFGKPIKDLQGNVSMVDPVADLSVYAKIIAIADCFESLVHHWGYPPEGALKLMGGDWLARFDPVYLKIFTSILSNLAGKLLNSERLAFFKPT